MVVDEVLEDMGSGLNYNRKKWNKLIEECTLGFVLLFKETGVIVEKYSGVIKKKTEYTFWFVVYYLQEASRYDANMVKELQDRDQPNAGANWQNQ